MGTTLQGPHRTSALFRATHLRRAVRPTLTSRLTAGIAIISLLAAMPPVFALGSAPPRHSGAPIILAVRIPGDTLFAGQTLRIAAEVQAADPSRLEYRFLVDEVVLQPWGSASVCEWATSTSDRGPHRITVQARTPRGEAQAGVDVFILHHRPVMPPES